MLKIKDLFNKIYIIFTNSKLVKWLFPVFLLFLVPNVSASELLFGSGTAYITIANGSTTYISTGDTTNNMPKIIYGLSASSTLDLGTISMTMYNDPDILISGNTYSYLIFDYCSTTNVSIIITNSSCTNACVSTGTFDAVNLGTSCTTGTYTGSRYLVQVPIQKWYYNSNAETYNVSSYIKFKNNNTWSSPVTVNQIFLSDEDYIITYKNQQELINKLNSVQTAITNMQNSINSNANTNTQSIINNQNSNTNAINGNIDDEFNKLKNQDHNYNNNANDTPSNQSDINSSNAKENQLMQSIDLDSSILDVQLNTNVTTWIWDIVTNLRSINGKITLLFVTILSLGIIKMVLNR